jgi:glycosyltransferase involved in cell wall biosynthesis
MPRPDLAEEFGPRAYRSGFWETVSIRAPERPGEIELRVNVRLADGSSANLPLGTMAAVENPRPVEIGRRRAAGKPLIAICMATFNPDLALFRTQVESIRAQTDESWICVISDDCSGPESFDAITATVAGDDRFVVSRAEENVGFYRNFERVLAMAPPEADLIALSDHDDYWYPDKLATLRAALGGAGLVYSDARRVDRAGNVRVATLWRGRRLNHSNLASLLISNTIPGAACLFRREVIERALPFPEGPGWDFHDHWLAVVALALGDIAYVDRPLYDYVQHPRAVLGRVASNPGLDRTASRTSLNDRLGVWRSAYFTRYLQAELHATVLLTRCGAELTSRKRRAVRLLLKASQSPFAFAWLATRPARAIIGRNETLGTEGIFVRGILWRFLIALHALGRRRPGGFADQLSVPSFEVRTHGLGARLRRWIAHTDHREAGDRSSHA